MDINDIAALIEPHYEDYRKFVKGLGYATCPTAAELAVWELFKIKTGVTRVLKGKGRNAQKES